MARFNNLWLLCMVWLLAAAALWFVLVPDSLSNTTFAVLNGTAVTLLLFARMVSQGHQRSTSQVIYDVEHEAKANR